MVKTSKLVSQKQNKTKKNWRQTIKTLISEFECFDVRPLHFLLLFTTKKQQELYCAISTNIMRNSVAYAWNSSYDACIYIKIIKHVKICYYMKKSGKRCEKSGKYWIKSGNREILRRFIFFLYLRLICYICLSFFSSISPPTKLNAKR